MGQGQPLEWESTVRLSQDLADRVQAYATVRAEQIGQPVTMAAAIRILLERGLTDALRKRKEDK